MYVYQTGLHAGESIASIVFSPEFIKAKQRLVFLDSFSRESKNSEHEALSKLIGIAMRSKPTAICPICGQRKVSLVAIHDDGYRFRLGKKIYLSCNNSKCKRQTEYHASYGCGDVTLRTCSFKLFEAKTRSRRTLIDPGLAWQIIQEAYQLTKVNLIDFLRKYNYS